MRANLKTASLAVLLLASSSAAQADGLVKVEQTIFGMDCAPCAYGMEKNLGKLAGVAKVNVSIEQGVAYIDFAPNSPTTLADIHDVVLRGGLTPEKIVLTVQGTVAQRGDKLVLTDGSKEEYLLSGLSAAQLAGLKPGAAVSVQGEAMSDPEASPVTLKVQDVKTL